MSLPQQRIPLRSSNARRAVLLGRLCREIRRSLSRRTAAPSAASRPPDAGGLGLSRPLSDDENRRTISQILAELPMKAPGKAKSSRKLAKIEQPPERPHEGGSSDLSGRTPLRPTGIRVMGDMPWGSHICLFYETKIGRAS